MEKEIDQINSKALGSNYTRSKIKDKAADMVVGLDDTLFTPFLNGNYGQDFKRSDFYNSSNNNKVNFISGTPAKTINDDDNLVHSGTLGIVFPKQIERDMVWPTTPQQRAKAEQIYKSSYSKNTNQNLDTK